MFKCRFRFDRPFRQAQGPELVAGLRAIGKYAADAGAHGACGDARDAKGEGMDSGDGAG